MPTEAEMWEVAHQRGWGRWPNIRFVEWVGRRYPYSDKRSRRFFEIGCGAGAQTTYLVQEGHQVWAVEQSQTAVDMALQRAFALPKPVSIPTIYTDNVLNMNFGPTFLRFDAVVDICTLQHLSFADAKAVLANARGWLKPDGAIFSMMRMTPQPSHQPPVEAIPLRTIDAGPALLDLFDGYKLKVGAEGVNRFDGTTVAHLLIEATQR